ncbi:MAG: glycosyltransferase family 2 protein [Microbacteriaceae bacterium]|nr:glycosyltransferase family 2 protein [Microbacteriaceae bacterium]
MQTRVTAILVAHSGAAYLERTLAGLARQTRRPDSIVTVDVGSTDNSAELLAAFGATQFVATSRKLDFGAAVAQALEAIGPAVSENDWIWLLAHDNAPQPTALERLLAAVEIAPSVVVAGPKLMRWDEPDVIDEFGETMTEFGASFAMVEGELDQAQHDQQSDVLAVAASGMLVRRSMWTVLGGFDPGLPSIDAALDFSVRARLAGYRVASVPSAKVASAGGPELFGRRTISDRRRASIHRSAQLHRRLVYAPASALPIHWLSLVPLAILRAIGQLLVKRPGAVAGEIGSAFAVAFGGSHIRRARRNFKRTRRLGWAAIAPLRMPKSHVRERRAQARETTRTERDVVPRDTRAGFVSHGGLWVVVLAGIVGLIAWGRLLAAGSLVGGTLAPLSGTVGQLWANVGYGYREIGTGFVGAADPFSYLLAVLGSITFWAPSLSVVLVFLLALPLAALGAWFAARRLTTRPFLPALAALLWALGPPLLGSLSSGQLGATIAHLLLPWLVLAVLSAPRSWAASAAAALLFAGVAASAPILVPALLIALIAWMAARPTSIHRLIGIPIPAAALFAPLVVQQIARGNPLGLLADPGVPTTGSRVSGLHLTLLSPGAGLDGWAEVVRTFALPGSAAAIVVAALLAPIGVLALVSLFVPGARRAIPAALVALLGFVTAVVATHLQAAYSAAHPSPIWPGSALSLFWMGLIAAALVGLESFRRAALPLGILAAIACAVLSIPLLGTYNLGTTTVQAGGRVLPAVVTVEAQTHPRIGTLVLTPQNGGSLAATIERGAGTTLDDQSTLASTSRKLSAADREVAVLAGNLASRSGFDASGSLNKLSIGFVLLAADAPNSSAHARAVEALDSNPLFTPVGQTVNGLLWRYGKATDANSARPLGNTDTPLGAGILIGQGVIFGLTLLLGIPTARRRRRGKVSGSEPEEPSRTFDAEVEHV